MPLTLTFFKNKKFPHFPAAGLIGKKKLVPYGTGRFRKIKKVPYGTGLKQFKGPV
jgi:hypothetical protein